MSSEKFEVGRYKEIDSNKMKGYYCIIHPYHNHVAQERFAGETLESLIKKLKDAKKSIRDQDEVISGRMEIGIRTKKSREMYLPMEEEEFYYFYNELKEN